MHEIEQLRKDLLAKLAQGEDPKALLKSTQLRTLLENITHQPNETRAAYGSALNALKQEIISHMTAHRERARRDPIDVTAPTAPNTSVPHVLASDQGSIHPVTQEKMKMSDIFYRMGFEVVGSREIDDEYHMFTSLNFPDDHPARDDYDTFMTVEGFVAPAHTSTMQQRIIKERKQQLEQSGSIAVVAMDRVFRNEDLDARHEHTFSQHEGIYVAKNVTVGELVGTLKTFLSTYYERDINVKITPFYFPFTEPSFEFSLSCPFCSGDEYCKVCGSEGWIELLGCGMIHPNVLQMAGVDPTQYNGFAWGGGVERLVMMKHSIEDIRLFNSAKLEFLKQFGGAV